MLPSNCHQAPATTYEDVAHTWAKFSTVYNNCLIWKNAIMACKISTKRNAKLKLFEVNLVSCFNDISHFWFIVPGSFGNSHYGNGLISARTLETQQAWISPCLGHGTGSFAQKTWLPRPFFVPLWTFTIKSVTSDIQPRWALNWSRRQRTWRYKASHCCAAQ